MMKKSILQPVGSNAALILATTASIAKAGAPKSSTPASHPASIERRCSHPEHGSVPPSHPNNPCLTTAFYSIWDSRASNSHPQTEAAAVPRTQNQASRKYRGDSISSPRCQPGSDRPGVAIRLTDYVWIGLSPLPVNEFQRKRYPSSDLFTRLNGWHATANLAIPLSGKTLKTPSLRHEGASKPLRHITLTDDSCKSRNRGSTPRDSHVRVFALTVQVLRNDATTDGRREFDQISRRNVPFLQHCSETRLAQYPLENCVFGGVQSFLTTETLVLRSLRACDTNLAFGP
jgi:hypothetical protein